MLQFVYTVFIGILLAVFVGLGIDTFYQAPDMRDYPDTTRSQCFDTNCPEPTDEELLLQKQEQENYQKLFETYDTNMQTYNRNVSIIALISAVVILIISIVMSKSLGLIADGLILGGTLTLTYSIIRGFGSDDQVFRFVVVTIGLIVAIVVGYVKFIKPTQASQS